LSDTVYYMFSWFLGIGSFVLLMLVIGHVLVALILIIPTWRICERAGFSGAWSLLHLVPVIGSFIVMAILAFGDWPNGEATPGTG
jgi:uncharacterized membrane protein YhaH (DUF805 family)